MRALHPTIDAFQKVAASGDVNALAPLLASEVRFLPPTYWKVWTGRDVVAAVLGHVGQVFTDFSYRRIMGEGEDWALEFQCRIGELDAVGVDLITLDPDGLITTLEVAMRPHKSIGALRDAMNARVAQDPVFAKFRDALTQG